MEMVSDTIIGTVPHISESIETIQSLPGAMLGGDGE